LISVIIFGKECQSWTILQAVFSNPLLLRRSYVSISASASAPRTPSAYPIRKWLFVLNFFLQQMNDVITSTGRDRLCAHRT
jgi:hypothetical protein